MTVQPTGLAIAGRELTIEWSDGRTLVYDIAALRRNCPCATCHSERARAEVDEDAPWPDSTTVTVRQMIPVGNYAYKILFSDGHDTGIYTLDLLQQLGRPKPE
jgi:DUF971 family protein